MPVYGTGARRGRTWGIYEIRLSGPQAGNPYTDVRLSGHFRYRNRIVDADGFYDGDGAYLIRFMPDEPASGPTRRRAYRRARREERRLHGHCSSAGNHGPVRVRYTTHFGYEDGTPYVPIGTTCYAWTHQGDVLEEQTLATLRSSAVQQNADVRLSQELRLQRK